MTRPLALATLAVAGVVAVAAFAAPTRLGQPAPAGSAAIDPANDVAALTSRVEALERRLTAVEDRDRAEEVPGQVRLKTLVTNLKDPRPGRYLRVDLVLVGHPGREQEFRGRVEAHRAAIRSRLIGYLADQTAEELRGQANVERVRGEVRAAVDRVLSAPGQAGQVKDVLFTEWVIQ